MNDTTNQPNMFHDNGKRSSLRFDSTATVYVYGVHTLIRSGNGAIIYCGNVDKADAIHDGKAHATNHDLRERGQSDSPTSGDTVPESESTHNVASTIIQRCCDYYYGGGSYEQLARDVTAILSVWRGDKRSA